MSKKILFSLITIGLVAALVGGGAFAYFHDEETSTGNTFQAGTIDIDVDGENPWTSSYEVEVAQVTGGPDPMDRPMEITLTGDTLLKPCQTGGIIFQITNVGNNPAIIWKHIEITDYDTGITVYPEGAPVASSEPEYEAELKLGKAKNDIGTMIIYDLLAWIDEDGDKVLDAGEVITMGIAPGPPVDPAIACEWIPLNPDRPLGPEETMTVFQSYHLHPDAGNEYQGDIMTFTIDLYAEQLGGPGKP